MYRFLNAVLRNRPAGFAAVIWLAITLVPTPPLPAARST